MIAKHIASGTEYELTGSCYFRDEEEKLFLAVSYIDEEETKTNNFPVDEETGEIVHPDFELIGSV